MMTATHVPRRIDALDDLFQLLDSELSAHGIDTGTAYKVKLAAEEIFTNLVRHQPGGTDRVEVDVSIDDEQIVVRLVDFDSPPFDPRSVPVVDPSRPATDRQPGGLGVFLVGSVLDGVDYEHRDGRLIVVLVKKRGE